MTSSAENVKIQPKHEAIPIVCDDDAGDTNTADVEATDDIQVEEKEAIMDTADPDRNENAQKKVVAVPAETETAPLSTGRVVSISATDDEEAPHISSFAKQKTIRTHFSTAFEWIEPILHYYPALWIRRDPKKTATTAPNLLATAVNIGLVVLYFVLQYFYQITGWNLFPAIDNVVWCFYIIFICAARILSIIYCAKYFNWPWSRESLPFYYQQQTEMGNKELVAKYRRLYIILSIAYIAIDLAVVIMETEALMPYYHFSILTYVLVKGLCRFCLLYPLLITTVVQSVIFMKYLVCLDQLWQEMKDPKTVDLQTTFEEYDKLYKLFRRDYSNTLRFCVGCYLAAEVLFFWDSFNFMGMHAVMVVLLLRELTIFWLFFHSASVLEEIHSRFTNEIWKHGSFFLNKEKKQKGDDGYYNYILQYVQHYSIYLKVGQVVVTTKNVIKFSFVLMVTRSLTYFSKAWAESKI